MLPADSAALTPTCQDDPRRYGARTSNPWSTRVLGVRLLLLGVP
eukprot:COSAG01_NODE_33584_length_561_cov_83.655844_2_plen_43_part_01